MARRKKVKIHPEALTGEDALCYSAARAALVRMEHEQKIIEQAREDHEAGRPIPHGASDDELGKTVRAYRERTAPDAGVSAVPAEYRYDQKADGELLTGAYLRKRFRIPQSTARGLARSGVLESMKVRMRTGRCKRVSNVYSWRTVLAYKTKRQRDDE